MQRSSRMGYECDFLRTRSWFFGRIAWERRRRARRRSSSSNSLFSRRFAYSIQSTHRSQILVHDICKFLRTNEKNRKCCNEYLRCSERELHSALRWRWLCWRRESRHQTEGEESELTSRKLWFILYCILSWLFIFFQPATFTLLFVFFSSTFVFGCCITWKPLHIFPQQSIRLSHQPFPDQLPILFLSIIQLPNHHPELSLILFPDFHPTPFLNTIQPPIPTILEFYPIFLTEFNSTVHS